MTPTIPPARTARTITDAVFAGVGELPSGRYPDRSFMGDCVAAAHLALVDAAGGRG